MEHDGANTSVRRSASCVSWREVASITAAFVVLSVLLVGAMTRCDPLHNMVFGGDPAFYLWALKWWPHALLSLHNPFDAPIFYPHGQNLAWTTSAPVLALIAAPITLLANPVLALNALNMLGLAANGVLAYLISRELDCKKSNAYVCALLFFFSNYTWGQLLGHLSIVVTGFAIAFVYITILRGYARIGRIKYIAIGTLLLALQFLTSVEVYATSIFFTAIVFVIFLLSFGWKTVGREAFRLACDLVAAVCGSLLLISPYLYQMFAHYESGLQEISAFVADPINYLIPTRTNGLLGHAFRAVSSKFTGNMGEQDAYLGLPLIALLAMAGRDFYSKPINRALLISLLVIVLCSFGPCLTILGVPTLWLPWTWVAKLPLIREALPSRFGLYTSLLAAILVGRVLTAVPKRDIKALAVAAICFLVPNVGLYSAGTIPESHFFSNKIYMNVIPEGARVLVLPTYEHGGYEPALWQAQANFWFTLTNGPAPAFASTGAKYGFLFLPGGNQTAYANELLRFMRDTGTQFVLTGSGASDGLTKAFMSLHFPLRTFGSIQLSEISTPTLDHKLTEMQTKTYLDTCGSLLALAKIGDEYVSNGVPLSLLTPSKVADNVFDARFGTPMSPDSPAKNWTTKGYWLGGWTDTIAVGISPVSNLIASRLYAMFRDHSQEIFFPYPKVFHGKDGLQESGQLVIVLKQGAKLPVSCNP